MITRRELISEIVERGLREAYLRAQPWVDIKDYNFKEDTEETPFYDRYYLPMEVQSQILDDIVEALNAHTTCDSYGDLIKNALINGGYKDVYKPLVEGGSPCRQAEKTLPLKDIIGEENANKAIELIDSITKFYTTYYEQHMIRGSVFSYPTSNKDTVIKYWKSKGKDITIDDSVYKQGKDSDIYDYSYNDYIRGECQNKDDEDYEEDN